MQKQRQNPNFLAKMFANYRNRLSKLHEKRKEQLDLHDNGFKSEQLVERYIIDEFHEQAKICVEINGDYIHANPKMFKESDVIRLPGNSYTAAEKWESDKRKIENLEKAGYKVITVWESDDIEFKRQEIFDALSKCI